MDHPDDDHECPDELGEYAHGFIDGYLHAVGIRDREPTMAEFREAMLALKDHDEHTGRAAEAESAARH